MAKEQIILSTTLIIASVFLFFGAIIWLIRRTIKNRNTPERYNKTGVSTVLVFSLIVLGSIWLLRYAVGYFAIAVSQSGVQQLTPAEEIVNSLFGAVRTFSMEEEYSEYIINIKALISEIVPKEHWCFAIIQFIVVAYASVLNLLAPILSGAIILEILASIFPRIRLWFSYIKRWRPKYFFSELNATSLALAKSIYDKEKSERPVLIFTDTYVDDEKEKEYELLLEAKKYGAICVRDDLAHVVKPKNGKSTFYLMDENELGNLQTLIGLTEESNIKYIKNSYIYLFVHTDAYVQIEKQINQDIKKYEQNKLLKTEEKPTIVPVRSYRNLIHNLFVDVPLYEPLINKKDSNKLSLTILGNGIIGTEAFLNAYWFGQMMISRDNNGEKIMSECDMLINVVSKDSADVFWSKIDYVNPEIKETVEVIGSTTPEDWGRLLRYDSNGNKNKPYCKVRYVQSDVKNGEFWEGDSAETKELLDSDYYIVALGNDSDNVSVAEKIRRAIGKNRVEGASNVDNTVIAYAIFDSKLVEKMNGEKYYQTFRNDKTDIYMYAFGGIDSVYSYDNVHMSRYKLLVDMIGASYDKLQGKEKLRTANIARKEGNENSNYNYWASLARAMHIKYKVYSLGLIKKSLFDFVPGETADPYRFESEHKAYVEEQNKKYISIALGVTQEDSGKTIEDYYEAHSKRHLLAWLEHRRWNAFTRIMGYQHADAKLLFDKNNTQKDMDLKLHACLVEARLPKLSDDDTYIDAQFLPDGLVDEDTTLASRAADCLDEVSYERKLRNTDASVADFKMYDYYRYEFDGYMNKDRQLNDKELLQLLQ